MSLATNIALIIFSLGLTLHARRITVDAHKLNLAAAPPRATEEAELMTADAADASQPLVKAADMLIKAEGRDDQATIEGITPATTRASSPHAFTGAGVLATVNGTGKEHPHAQQEAALASASSAVRTVALKESQTLNETTSKEMMPGREEYIKACKTTSLCRLCPETEVHSCEEGRASCFRCLYKDEAGAMHWALTILRRCVEEKGANKMTQVKRMSSGTSLRFMIWAKTDTEKEAEQAIEDNIAAAVLKFDNIQQLKQGNFATRLRELEYTLLGQHVPNH